MTVSHSEYNDHTTGQTVVSAFPSQVNGKIVLITGANPGGIGLTTATSLATASPQLLIVAGRTQSKLDETLAEIKKVNPKVACKSLILDLSSQQSCKEAAKKILDDDEIPRIDILINNAGVMNIPERTVATDGIEMQFATNHVGHFLFTNLILPKIKAAAAASPPGSTRIVNLSSRAVLYAPVRFSDHNFTKYEKDLPQEEHMAQSCRDMWNEPDDKPYIAQASYGQSKSANVLFSVELNKRLFEKTGILSNAVHPGGIQTNLGRHMDQQVLSDAFEKIKASIPTFYYKNLEDGCSTTLVAALDPKVTRDDLFYADCQVANWAPKWCTDPAKATQLWELSEKLVGQTFNP